MERKKKKNVRCVRERNGGKENEGSIREQENPIKGNVRGRNEGKRKTKEA